MGRNIDHGNELCFLPLDLKEVYTENINWLSKSGDQAPMPMHVSLPSLKGKKKQESPCQPLAKFYGVLWGGGECVQFHMILPTDQW